ncbi:MAG TPA: hypothetical protein VFA59_06530 [Vicinamibacterales bacterium]|nr:hypothetical protein [Vicinamibacterales bacterium]
MSALDKQIDELYQLPLTEFTTARNALVKTQRGADATHVRTLQKPTVVAWAVNQVYWRARPTFEKLMKAGERLRAAQIAALTGKAADLREANEAHRKALADAVKEAEKIASGSGSHPSPDALVRTFEALSLAKDPPAHPGRLSDALQPAGFEALAGVTPTVRLKPDTPSEKTDRKKAAEERKRAEEEKKRAAEIKRAEAALERAKAKMRLAEEALKRTRDHS